MMPPEQVFIPERATFETVATRSSVGVRRNDFVVKSRRRVEVVIDLIDAGFLEPPDVILAEKTQARADVHSVTRLHLADRVEHFLEHASARRAARYHHAERADIQTRRTVGRRENLLARHERVLLDLRRRDRRLRAVVTVLRTQPALRIEQKVQADAISKMVTTHAIGGGELVQQGVVGRIEHGAGVVARDDGAGERLIGERIPVR